jgi:molybdopterin-guanine dinucleotide biosynthesis protein A
VGIASVSANTPYVFVLACDVPFVTAQSIVHVLKGVRGEDVIIPRTQYGFEALQPVYSPSCIAIMFTRIGLQSLKVTDLLPFVSVRGVGEHPAFTDRGGYRCLPTSTSRRIYPLFSNLAMDYLSSQLPHN